MKILVASSGNFDDAADPSHSVFSFPWPEDADIHVLSVAELIYPLMVGMVPDVVDTTDVELPTDEQAKATAERVAQHFQSLGFAAKGLHRKGDPESTILDYAKEWGADLIVVGSHDRSRMERLLIRSVSENVVKRAPCSVLVLKHRTSA